VEPGGPEIVRVATTTARVEQENCWRHRCDRSWSG